VKLAILALLYLVEGLPFGLQTQALPLYLRDEGMSLARIGSLAILSAPWLCKPLLAPFVDRFGRRKAWILAFQGGMAAVGLVAAVLPSGLGLLPIAGLLLLLNSLAAAQDIAVDGLAVDLLGPGELGVGNTMQVVGYKAGMFLGGWAIGQAAVGWGWRGLFGCMAALVTAAMVLFALWPEPPLGRAPERERLADIVATLGRALATRSGAWLLLAVATYKLGESLVDPMFKLFVRDAGFRTSTVLTWTALYGMTASIAGSLAGGLLAARVPLGRALTLAAVLRLGPLVGQWIITQRPASAEAVVTAIVAENFFGGALTTVMFAFMMSRVDRRIGATHYTVLATLEVVGKMPGSTLSGWIAGAFGYGVTFATGALLSLAYLALLAFAPRRELQGAQVTTDR
jgi:MFS family permease